MSTAKTIHAAAPQPTMDIHFPLETWTEILSHLANPDCWSSLASVARVSRLFHMLVESVYPIMFREIALEEPCPPNNGVGCGAWPLYPLRPFTRMFVENPKARNAVRTLSLSCPCNNGRFRTCPSAWTYFPQALYGFLPTVTGLRHVSLSRMVLNYPVLEELSKILHLTSLEVRRASLPDHRFSSARPIRLRITSLSVVSCSRKSDRDLTEFLSITCTTALKYLTILDGLDHTTSWMANAIGAAVTPDSLHYLALSYITGDAVRLLLKQNALRTFKCQTSVCDWKLPGEALSLLEILEAPPHIVMHTVIGRPVSNVSIPECFGQSELLLTLESIKLSTAPLRRLSLKPYELDNELLDNIISFFPLLKGLFIDAQVTIVQTFVQHDFIEGISGLPCCVDVGLSTTGCLPSYIAIVDRRWQLEKVVRSMGQRSSSLRSARLQGVRWIRVGFWDWVEDHESTGMEP